MKRPVCKEKKGIESESKHNFILYVKQLHVSTIVKIKFSLYCDSIPFFSFT